MLIFNLTFIKKIFNNKVSPNITYSNEYIDNKIVLDYCTICDILHINKLFIIHCKLCNKCHIRNAINCRHCNNCYNVYNNNDMIKHKKICNFYITVTNN